MDDGGQGELVAPATAGAVRRLLTGEQAPRPALDHAQACADPALADPRWTRYRRRPPDPGEPARLGISCSGGGVRSATYNLGALQELRRAGLLDPSTGGATYLAAVSGGCYIAAAHAITAGTSDPTTFSEELPPWAAGGPEERHLRVNSTYLAPGASGLVWLAQNLIYGLFVNLVPFLLAAFLVGRVLGWTYAAWLHPGLRHPVEGVGHLGDLAAHWAIVAGLAFASFCALGIRRWLDRVRRPPTAAMTTLQTWAVRLAGAAALAGVVLIALPGAIVAGRELVSGRDAAVLPDLARQLGWERPPDLTVWFVLTEAATLAAGAAAIWRANRRIGARLLPVLAPVLGPLLLAVPTVAWASGAADDGLTGEQAVAAALVAAVLVGYGVVGENVRWSMHPFYRERLSQGFVLARRRSDDGVVAEPLPYEDPVLLSGLQVPPTGAPGHVPELVVCAALNVSDPVVPPGRASEGFSFTASESGSFLTGWVPTSTFEQGRGTAKLTVPALMAISGAALSPSMGKMTRPWARFLLAMFNVRLGVWVPNPLHSGWPRPGAGLPAPLRRIAQGWSEPGPLYVAYEALGRNHLDRDYVNVSDGGHWENLGLVELLRRGCTEIICIDAAGDALDTFNTIGEAIALARAELGVEIHLDDLSPLRVDPATGTSRSDHVVAGFSYPDGTAGVLVYLKAAIPADAPWDLHSYRRRDPRFPCHSTGDQLFDDVQFESYRALGRLAGHHAADELGRIRSRRAPTG